MDRTSIGAWKSVARLAAHSSAKITKSDKRLVDVAPTPIFSRFKRLYNGMICMVEVLGSVFARRRITAADMAALQAEAQVNPVAASGQTLLATVGSSRFDIFNVV